MNERKMPEAPKSEGWFSRRHETREEHEIARERRRKLQTDKAQLAELNRIARGHPLRARNHPSPEAREPAQARRAADDRAPGPGRPPGAGDIRPSAAPVSPSRSFATASGSTSARAPRAWAAWTP